MMRHLILAATLLLAIAAPSAAEEEPRTLSLGVDSFLAGQEVVFDKPGRDDLFAAGEIVRARADIAGSAHIAGRKISMTGAVGGDAYLAGFDVVLVGPVAGDATLSGYNVSVADVGSNLRISGGNLVIDGAVAGYAMIAGETVRINGTIAGDAIISARELILAADAKVGGTLTLFEEEPGTFEIPESFVPPDRVTRRDIREWEDVTKDLDLWDWQSFLQRFLTGVIVVAALASLVAAVFPRPLAELRESLLERPFRNLLFGFLTQSVFIGGAILLFVTVVGIIASPAVILAAVVAGLAGYIVAVYAFGVGLLIAVGRPLPATIGKRALAASLGAVTVGVLALVPLLGWIFVILLMLAGVGAIILNTLKPAFFVPQ